MARKLYNITDTSKIDKYTRVQCANCGEISMRFEWIKIEVGYNSALDGFPTRDKKIKDIVKNVYSKIGYKPTPEEVDIDIMRVCGYTYTLKILCDRCGFEDLTGNFKKSI